MRRDWRIEDIGLRIRVPGGNLRPFNDGFAISTLASSSLDRFPIFAIQRRDKDRRKQRLSHSCVRACYEQIRTHPSTASVSRAETSASRNESMSAFESFAVSD